jgi:hypothetical protein
MMDKIKAKGKISLFLFVVVIVFVALAMKSNLTLADCTSVCLDFDGDDRGNPASPNCVVPNVLDCDDANAAVWTSVLEVSGGNCDDGIDNDCDGLVDCNDTDDCSTDASCVGSCTIACSGGCFTPIMQPLNTVAVTGNCCGTGFCYDCDSASTRNMAGDCVAGCIDDDGDRYAVGNTVDWTLCANCGSGAETCLGRGDCDDSIATGDYSRPGLSETCDNRDNDCDSQIDEGCDDDGDGYCEGGMDIWNNPVLVCLNTTATGVGAGDDCDDNALTGATFYPGAIEVCDNASHDCDGDNFNTIERDDCPLACSNDSLDWVGGTGSLGCCGDDMYEGGFGTNIFQPTDELLPDDRCGDGVDNNCSGTCDLVAGACYGGASSADPTCTGTCNDTGEHDIGALPCDKCSVPGNQDSNDVHAMEDWTSYPVMVDDCDSDCSIVSNTVSIVDYENGGELSCDDNIDNDCDGYIDCLDTIDCLPSLTSNQNGVCLGALQTCNGVGDWIDDYSTIADYQATEICSDSLDNNCDGNVNESCGACVPTADPTEICDGFDNDCDGNIDNGLTAPLTTNQTNVCSGALQTCTGAGGWIDDYSIIADYQATEICSDSLDNNCDGNVNEGCVVFCTFSFVFPCVFP